MKYVFIHGLGQNSSSWNKTLSFMEKQDNFICIDLLEIIENKDCNYDNIYNAFSKYCNNILEPINLCGLSLGGILSLNYVLDNPKKVNSLILIGTQDKMPKNLLKIQNFIFKLIPKKLFNINGFNKMDFIKIINSMMDLDFSKKINSISCKTLIICGIKDSINKSAAKRLANNINNAKLLFINKSGHTVNEDNPKGLALEIIEFYKNFNYE